MTRFSQPPRALRRPGIKLDNVAVVPASLLPFKREWQRLQDELPNGSTLLVLPKALTRSRAFLEGMGQRLSASGRRVKTISSEYIVKGMAHS